LKYVAFFAVRPEEFISFIETWADRVPIDERVKVVLPPHTSAEPVNGITGFTVFESDDFQAIADYLVRYELTGAKVKLMPVWEDSALAKELVNFREGKEKAELDWRQSVFKRMSNWGSTKNLEVLPLIDWQKSRDDLRVELGVSYLIKTDERAILFDMGLNARQGDPSPLLHNMNALGISLKDFDTIVISHNHGDHVGGDKWARNKTFSLTAHQIDLAEKTVYTPIPMTYPRLHPTCTEDPTVISKGVATIGVIPNYLFRTTDAMGPMQEQALAINVDGKGIVLIVGCGHQTLPKIIERTETLFEEPIYGLIGGLHFAVRGGPIRIMGMSQHEYVGTWKLPWQPITKEELQESIRLLRDRDPKVVALSPHDSSETSMATFRNAFPTAYREIKVGQNIAI
jgi:7,8-dihydropterin-6-yl-methyl-4-(beta-D-ribofuranosyl)aminobenzene 5'-phosphate synthase